MISWCSKFRLGGASIGWAQSIVDLASYDPDGSADSDSELYVCHIGHFGSRCGALAVGAWSITSIVVHLQIRLPCVCLHPVGAWSIISIVVHPQIRLPCVCLHPNLCKFVCTGARGLVLV